ncbi:MAG: PAS domain S-box protein [Bacteroidales bacterium]|nr:PAS domain S-box protein [Bacteroidales bacterium]
METNSDIDSNIQIKLLNQLFAAQTMFHIFPDETKLGEFITQALISIPGIKACFFCSRQSECKPNKVFQEIKSISEYLRNIPDEQDHFPISKPLNENLILFPLQTTKRSFGIICLFIENIDDFNKFKISLNNFINVVALDMENRWHKMQLVKHSENLEELVDKRTSELQAEIAERKLAENAMSESEIKFRTVFEQSVDAIGVSQMGKHSFVNSAYLNLFGYSHSDELISKSILDLIAPTERNKILSNIQSRSKGDLTPQVYETKGLRKDGSEFDLDVHASLYEFAGKSLTLVILRDITKQNLNVKALFENEQRLSSIYDAVGDIIYYLSVEEEEQYRFSSVNLSFSSVTGIPPDAIIGKLVNEIIPEPSLSMVLGKYKDAITKKTIVRWEETSEYPTGWLTGEVSVAPVFDKNDRCTHLVGAVHDITERKKAEEEIKLLNVQLLKAEEIANFGFLDWNLTTNAIHLSPEVKRIYEISEDVGNEIEHMNKVIHPDDIVFVNENLELAAKGIKDYNIDHRIVKKDGSIVWLNARAELFKDENGKPTRLLGTIIDITERKNAEEELNKHRDNLENLVKERTMEIEEKNMKLERINKAFVGRELRMVELKKEIEELKGTSTGSV